MIGIREKRKSERAGKGEPPPILVHRAQYKLCRLLYLCHRGRSHLSPPTLPLIRAFPQIYEQVCTSGGVLFEGA